MQGAIRTSEDRESSIASRRDRAPIRRIFSIGLVGLSSVLPAVLSADGLHILVQPFQNTGNPQHGWLSAGMTDSVSADLGRIKGIQVISESDRKKALEEIQMGQSGLVRDSDVAKVGTMLGAHVIFAGSYAVAGDQVRVIAKLVRVESGAVEKSLKIDGTLNGIFALQDRIVTELLAETEKTNITKIKPPKVDDAFRRRNENRKRPVADAYELFGKGLEVEVTNVAQALSYFEQAIAISPEYKEALTHAGYAVSLRGDTKKAHEYLARAERLYRDAGEADTLAFADLLATRAGIHYGAREYDESIRIYDEVERMYRRLNRTETIGFAYMLYGQGSALQMRGDKQAAIKKYSEAIQLFDKLNLRTNVGYGHLLYGVGYLFLTDKRYDEALKLYNQARAVYSNLNMTSTRAYAGLMDNIGYCHEATNEKENALKAYREALDSWKKAGFYGPEVQRVEERVRVLSE